MGAVVVFDISVFSFAANTHCFDEHHRQCFLCAFSAVVRSLSARILRYFGDTPLGMVLSAMEFADICIKSGFLNFVFSLKSSNPKTMVQAYRLLAHLMAARGALFPLHLGVTEAGEGEPDSIAYGPKEWPGLLS